MNQRAGQATSSLIGLDNWCPGGHANNTLYSIDQDLGAIPAAA